MSKLKFLALLMSLMLILSSCGDKKAEAATPAQDKPATSTESKDSEKKDSEKKDSVKKEENTEPKTEAIKDDITKLSATAEKKMIKDLDLSIDLEDKNLCKLYADFDDDKNLDLIYYCDESLYFIKVVGKKYRLVENDFNWLDEEELYNPYLTVSKAKDAITVYKHGLITIKFENPKDQPSNNYKNITYVAQYLKDDKTIESLNYICTADKLNVNGPTGYEEIEGNENFKVSETVKGIFKEIDDKNYEFQVVETKIVDKVYASQVITKEGVIKYDDGEKKFITESKTQFPTANLKRKPMRLDMTKNIIGKEFCGMFVQASVIRKDENNHFGLSLYGSLPAKIRFARLESEMYGNIINIELLNPESIPADIAFFPKSLPIIADIQQDETEGFYELSFPTATFEDEEQFYDILGKQLGKKVVQGLRDGETYEGDIIITNASNFGIFYSEAFTGFSFESIKNVKQVKK